MAADSVSTNWRPLAVGVYQDGHLAVGVEFAEGQLLLFALPDVHRFEIQARALQERWGRERCWVSKTHRRRSWQYPRFELSVSGLGIGFESVEFGLKRPRRSSFGFAWKFSVAPARAGDRNYAKNLKATALVAIELDRLGFISARE